MSSLLIVTRFLTKFGDLVKIRMGFGGFKGYFDSGDMRAWRRRTNSARSGAATSETAQNWKPLRDHFIML